MDPDGKAKRLTPDSAEYVLTACPSGPDSGCVNAEQWHAAKEAIERRFAPRVDGVHPLGSLVFSGYRNTAVVETLPPMFQGAYVSWWDKFVTHIHQTWVEAGGFNAVTVVDVAKVQIPSEFWKGLYPDLGPVPTRLVVRKSKGRTPALANHAEEILASCYAAKLGIAPRVLAAYCTTTEVLPTWDHVPTRMGFPRVDDTIDPKNWKAEPPDWWENETPGADEPIRDEPSRLVIVAEHWDVPLDQLVDRQLVTGGGKDDKTVRSNVRSFTNRFPQLFVALLQKAASGGLFLADLKSTNMVVRNNPKTKQLELAFIDFDPAYCVYVPGSSEQRSPDHETIKCIVLFSAAMFMGFHRCHANDDDEAVWTSLRKKVGEVLEAEYGALDLSQEGLCHFLDVVEARTGAIDRAAHHREQTLKRLSDTVVKAITMYHTTKVPKAGGSGCFKRTEGRPLFAQFYAYAMLDEGVHSGGTSGAPSPPPTATSKPPAGAPKPPAGAPKPPAGAPSKPSDGSSKGGDFTVPNTADLTPTRRQSIKDGEELGRKLRRSIEQVKQQGGAGAGAPTADDKGDSASGRPADPTPMHAAAGIGGDPSASEPPAEPTLAEKLQKGAAKLNPVEKDADGNPKKPCVPCERDVVHEAILRRAASMSDSDDSSVAD